MSKGTAFFAFVAGIATGVSLTMLTFTDKGQRIIENIEKKGEKLYNDLTEGIDDAVDDFDSEDTTNGEE